MIEKGLIASLVYFLCWTNCSGQDSIRKVRSSMEFSGQLSAYTHVNPSNELPWWSGARYIPRLNGEVDLRDDRLFDFEASANIYGNIGIQPFDSTSLNGKLKPYRVWARFSSRQLEIRAGLQKINFGSASILRPLMWFDQIDPRDPLQLTDGVWGIRARYYFMNNANIWLWGLYGNTRLKGWETFVTTPRMPEFGGRIQIPVPRGEAAVSYHHRTADASDISDGSLSLEKVPENRFGFDAKFDMVVGWWVEGSWSHYSEDLGTYTNQQILNLGIDYTFGLGNGLTVIFEQLLAGFDQQAFEFQNTLNFSLLNLTYPVGIFDQLNAIVYYDWTNQRIYNFVNWQRQFNNLTLYLMGYINPRDYLIPTQGAEEILYAGSGLQVMLVFNH